jgi:hypothetical protein
MRGRVILAAFAATIALAALAGPACARVDEPVLFSCEPSADDGTQRCPDGYHCHTDGCCWRDGVDPDTTDASCDAFDSLGSTGTDSDGETDGG